MARFTNYKGDKNRVRDYGHHNNLQHRPSFDSYYTGNTKYYSGIDAEIYIGDQYVDEVFNIQYQIVQESKPIFGYNSYLYDEMAVGSRIVTGSFAINFTETNFLGKVLNTIQKRKIMAGADRVVDSINSPSSNSQYLSSMDPSIYRSKKPIWDQQFEIMVAYGERHRKIFGGALDNIEIIKGVQLNARHTEIDASGNPIMEVYNFTGRDIVYGGESRMIQDHIPKPTDNKKDTRNDIIMITNKEYYVDGDNLNIELEYELQSGYRVNEVSVHPSLNNKYYLMKFETRNKIGSDIDRSIMFKYKDILKDNQYSLGDQLSLYIEFDIIKNSDGISTKKEFDTTINMK